MPPANVRAALDARLEGVSRSDLAERAMSISQRYRASGKSMAVIRDPLDALAYAASNRPASLVGATNLQLIASREND